MARKLEQEIVRAGIGFSNHACDRFDQRAGVSLTRDAARAELIRLARLKGVVTTDHPDWPGSGLHGNLAYLVLDGWILCGLAPPRPGTRHGTWTVSTLVTLHDYTWQQALDARVATIAIPRGALPLGARLRRWVPFLRGGRWATVSLLLAAAVVVALVLVLR
jgi:hypothetical protein